jgi:fumarylacetoacetate (FAA) hydrolase
VSNRDRSTGAGCLFERRAEEIIAHGEAQTSFLQFGDRIKIEMLDQEGKSIFGAIEQQVVAQHTKTQPQDHEATSNAD